MGAALAPQSMRADGGVLLLFGFSVVNVANFAFHVLVSRLLGPQEYGTLSSLLAVLVVLQVPVGALQVVITHEVASRRGAGLPDGALGRLLYQATAAGVVGAAVMLVAIGPLKAFLHLDSGTPVVLLAFLLLGTLVDLVPRSALLGYLRLRVVAVGLVLGAGLRLAAAAAFVKAGLGVNGAILASTVAQAAVVGVFMYEVRKDIRSVEERPAISVSIRLAALSIGAFTGFWLLIAIDTLLARHYLPRAESGFYAAAGTAGRMVFFLPSAVAVVLFPRFARFNGSGFHARRLLLQGALLVMALGLVGTAIIAIARHLVIELIFGPAYAPSASVVAILAFSSAVAGVVSLLIYFHLARRSWVALLPAFGALVAIGGAAVWHDNMTQIALVAMWSFLLVALAMSLALWEPLPAIEGELSAHPLWQLRDATLDLTLVIPYYNPGTRFGSNLERIHAVLASSGCSYEIIAVSDGSTDGSEAVSRSFAGENMQSVVLPRNRGKGQALRTGLALGRGRYLGFIDADGDLDPELLSSFLDLMRSHEPDIVLGSKLHPESIVDYPAMRRIYSWTYQQLVRVLFNLSVRDTQTGLKLVRREVLANVLPRMLEKRFAFDLEMLVVARRIGYRRFLEAPVRMNERFSSTISPSAVIKMLIDTAAIYYRLRFLRYYDEAAAAIDRSIPPDAGSEAAGLVAVLAHEGP